MIVCPFCSEEHPVTLDRCPLTGQQLRAPAPIEALPVREERVRFPALLAEAARLYRQNVMVFLLTASIAFVPFAGVQAWSALQFAPLAAVQQAMRINLQATQQHRRLSADEQAEVQRAMEAVHPDRKRFLLGIALMLMLVPLFVAAQILSHAALVPLVGDRALGGDMGPGRAWLAVGLRAGAVLWTAALSTLATMIGFLFCLLPGIVAAIGFSLAMPVVLLERRRGVDALRRSWQLMRTEWPRVVGLWLIAVVGMMAVTSVLSIPFFRLFDDPGEGMLALFSGWTFIGLQGVQLLVSMLLFPLPVIGTTLIYLHARREQENIPLAELQQQMRRAATGT
ncbi:MAG: hypothetical protein ACXWLR_15590 [Myxococcales bacterium]